MTLSLGQRAIVVDASVAIPFLRGDQPWVERWDQWVRGRDLLLAPPHFFPEVANGLLRGTSIRSRAHVVTLLRKLFDSNVEMASRGLIGLEDSVDLADRYRLSVYDAGYLSLALDVDGELATLDRALTAAATAEGVPVIPPE